MSCDFRDFCSLETSSRRTCKEEEFCLNRLMGHRVRVAQRGPSDRTPLGCRGFRSPHVLLFGHPCRSQERLVHLKLRERKIEVCVKTVYETEAPAGTQTSLLLSLRKRLQVNWLYRGISVSGSWRCCVSECPGGVL